MLGRPGDAAGAAFWTGALDAGLADRPAVVAAFSESGEHAARVAGAAEATGAGHSVSVNGAFSASSDPQGGGASAALVGGAAGNDTLYAGVGDGTLDGAGGDDVLVGGPGDDLFVFRPNSGHDTIQGCHPGDRILFLDVPAGGAAVVAGEGGIYGSTTTHDVVHGAGARQGAIHLDGIGQADLGWVRQGFRFGSAD